MLNTLDYTGRCIPAHEVGGDYYDFLDLGSGSVGFVLADVSGKGIAAALLMANLQGCFRSQVERRSPAAALREVNRLFCESTPPEQFATVFFGQYDDQTRRFRYVNCGHLPPVLARAAGGIERLEGDATVLGVFPNWNATETVIGLAPGDTLVLCSDGVTEAGIEAGQEFDEARLISLVEAGRNSALDPAIDAIVEAARAYSTTGQSDDITVVGIRAL